MKNGAGTNVTGAGILMGTGSDVPAVSLNGSPGVSPMKAGGSLPFKKNRGDHSTTIDPTTRSFPPSR
jgi:hypothetical protein